MNKIFHFSVIISYLIFSSLAIAGQPVANICEQQLKVQNLLLQAFSYITMHGKIEALKTFNDPKGHFYHPQEGLYVFAMKISGKDKGVLLTHPQNPGLIGKNRYNMKDYDNKYHVRDIVHAARQGGDWITYSWHNPKHDNAIETKWTFVLPVDKEWAIGTGFYTK